MGSFQGTAGRSDSMCGCHIPAGPTPSRQSGPGREWLLSRMRSQHHEAWDTLASALAPLHLSVESSFPCLLFGDVFWRGFFFFFFKQYNTVIKSLVLASDSPQPAGGNSLVLLSFFFCKMEIIIMFISYGYLEDQMSHSTYSSWFTENII